jgi:uncharacterized protein YukE
VLLVAEISVSPDDLRAAAAVISEAAGLVGHAVDARSGELNVTGDATWHAAKTLGAAVGDWGPYLQQLRQSMQGSADGLRQMADAFVQADWQAARRQRRAGGVFEE